MSATRQFRLLLTAIFFPMLTVQYAKGASKQARDVRWAPVNDGHRNALPNGVNFPVEHASDIELRRGGAPVS